ncbi:MAG: hypothetical protein R2681_05100 [Pyrinomonadaceae bacterium]
MKNKNHNVLALILVLIFSSVIAGQHGSRNEPAPSGLTAAQWRDDLRYFADRMRKTHKNLFFKMSEEEFDAAVAKLDSRIPDLKRHEIIAELMRIVAMTGDGHTRLRFELATGRDGIFPVAFYRFEDGLYVKKAAKEYEEVVGAKILKIGNDTAESALQKAAELTAADNIMGKKAMAPYLLSIPEITDALGISAGLDSLSITVEKPGGPKVINISRGGELSDLFRSPENWISARTGSVPLYEKDPQNNYWYEYLPDTKTVYVKYNAVQNKQDESIAQFFGKVFEFIEKNPVEKFVIDMRNNGGGNNTLNRPIYLGLIRSKLNKKGKAFAIIGRETFSAAQNGVNKLEELTNITFVGEPTAAHPNHYGDAARITLPNSKLVVSASTLYWQDLDPRDTRRWTAPEIAAETTFEDYKLGRDPALEAVFNFEKGISYDDLVDEATNGDFPTFIKKYREFKKDPRRKYYETQTVMNRFGYELLGQKQIDKAIEVFKLNVEYYPESSNVYDSLGEAYLEDGKLELALINYKRSVEIDPGNEGGKNAIRKIEQLLN